MRNLAILDWNAGRLEEAAELLAKACRLVPDLTPLVVECGRCLIEADKTQEWLDLSTRLDSGIRVSGRIRLLEAQAALQENNLDAVERFFKDRVSVADLREGENSLTDLWFAYHESRISAEEPTPGDETQRAKVRTEYPVPGEFDFRMGRD